MDDSGSKVTNGVDESRFGAVQPSLMLLETSDGVKWVLWCISSKYWFELRLDLVGDLGLDRSGCLFQGSLYGWGMPCQQAVPIAR